MPFGGGGEGERFAFITVGDFDSHKLAHAGLKDWAYTTPTALETLKYSLQIYR